MSGTTTNLELFKYNPNTDGDQTFNIDNALNNNWDSLDTLIGALTSLTTTQKASLVGAINELVTNLGGKAAKDLGNLDATGQGILDAKIEAEALAAQNGYIKFKLNGISNLIIQWGYSVVTTSSYGLKTITFPIAFNNVYSIQLTGHAYNSAFTDMRTSLVATSQNDNVSSENITNTSFTTQSYWTHYWIAIGI